MIEIQIKHEILDDTVRLERERGYEKMDEDSLMKCLPVKIFIISKKDGKVLMKLDKAALLGFALDLSEVCGKLASKTFRRYEINDFYSTYRVLITKVVDSLINVKEVYGKYSFDIDNMTFVKAATEFINKVNSDVLRLFPHLKSNPYYTELRKLMLDL